MTHGDICSLLMRSAAFLLLMIVALATAGQWDLPVQLMLDGSDDAARQVTGLAPPESLDAAVSLEAARRLAVSYATVSGQAVLSGTLVPAPVSYTTGMLVTITPLQTNATDPQLNLNGLGAAPLVRQDGLPLLAGELPAGVPVRSVFDGTAFRILGSVRLPCPDGYTIGSRDFCIADTSQAPQTFFLANVTCADQQARLCTVSEWVSMCETVPEFFTSVSAAEWIDHAANFSNYAKVIGYGTDGVDNVALDWGCRFGLYDPPTAINRFRCCISR